jgi:hypothetical protein
MDLLRASHYGPVGKKVCFSSSFLPSIGASASTSALKLPMPRRKRQQILDTLPFPMPVAELVVFLAREQCTFCKEPSFATRICNSCDLPYCRFCRFRHTCEPCVNCTEKLKVVTFRCPMCGRALCSSCHLSGFDLECNRCMDRKRSRTFYL